MSAKASAGNERRRYAMLNDPIRKVIPAMALPTMVSSIVMSLYNLADTFFVSSLGTSATAAVGVNQSLMNLVQTFGMSLAIGANSYIARLLGAKEDKKANQVLSTTFFSAFGIGALMLIFGMIFMRPMVGLLGAKGNVVPYAMDYASYILYAAPFMTAVFVMNQCLRAEGNSTFAMIGMLSGSLLNIGLDPLFIFVFKLGVAGAAAATAISKFVSFMVLLIPYLRRHAILHITYKDIKFEKTIVSEVVKMGLPTLFRAGFMTVSNVITNNVAATFSESALAAISVANKVMHLLASAIMGFGQGFQVVAGFNWGAKRYDRVRHAYRFSMFVGVIGSAVLSAIGIIFARPIISAFTESDNTLISLAILSLVVQCIATPLHVWVIVTNSMYTALGKAKGAAVLSLSRQCLFMIPSVIVLSLLFKAEGLACAQAVSDVLTMSIGAPFTVYMVRTLKKKIAEAGQEEAYKAEIGGGTV